MKIQAKLTKVENVEIDPVEFLTKIYKSMTPKGLTYLDLSDCPWYAESGYDFSKGVPTYRRDRKATDEEIAIKNAFILLKNKVMSHEMA